MENRIHLLISTNGGTILDEHVDYVLLPLEGGEYGILADHSPLIGSLDVGVIKYTIDKEADYVAVSGGVASVNNNEIVILARSAEKADTIDVARAQASEKRALDRKSNAQASYDMHRLESSLRRSLARQKAHRLKMK